MVYGAGVCRRAGRIITTATNNERCLVFPWDVYAGSKEIEEKVGLLDCRVPFSASPANPDLCMVRTNLRVKLRQVTSVSATTVAVRSPDSNSATSPVV